MQLTIVGLFVFVAGFVILLWQSLAAMLVFAMICTLMGGSAALVMTSLGGSTVLPSNIAMVFLVLRTLSPDGGAEPKPFSEALRANMFFFIFATYALLSAMVIPRIFAGTFDVVPMKPSGVKGLYDTFPLKFTPQNITTPVYIFGSFFLAFCSYIVVRRRMGIVYFVKGAVAVAWIHVLLGLAGVLLPAPVWDVMSAIFRNGSYGQLDQSVNGYARIAGIFPEASGYAAYGFGWFALVMELWLRDIMPRRTGPAAAALALVLVASTSSSAYASLAGYGLLIFLRMLIFPNFFRFDKMMWIFGATVVLVILSTALLVLVPSLADTMLGVLERMTIKKVNSNSGLQRAFWAKQGLKAFQLTYGLGVGAGSFRSSSILTAIWGSVGVVGTTAFIAYLGKIFRPGRNDTYTQSPNNIEAVGVASAWAAVIGLIPAALASPTPDPGSSFAILAGVALGLRSLQLTPRRSVRFFRKRRDVSEPLDSQEQVPAH